MTTLVLRNLQPCFLKFIMLCTTKMFDQYFWHEPIDIFFSFAGCFKLASCNSESTNQNIRAYGVILIVSVSLELLVCCFFVWWNEFCRFQCIILLLFVKQICICNNWLVIKITKKNYMIFLILRNIHNVTNEFT